MHPGIWKANPATIWWVIMRERNSRIIENVASPKFNLIPLLSVWSNIVNVHDTHDFEAMIDLIRTLHYL